MRGLAKALYRPNELAQMLCWSDSKGFFHFTRASLLFPFFSCILNQKEPSLAPGFLRISETCNFVPFWGAGAKKWGAQTRPPKEHAEPSPVLALPCPYLMHLIYTRRG